MGLTCSWSIITQAHICTQLVYSKNKNKKATTYVMIWKMENHIIKLTDISLFVCLLHRFNSDLICKTQVPEEPNSDIFHFTQEEKICIQGN